MGKVVTGKRLAEALALVNHRLIAQTQTMLAMTQADPNGPLEVRTFPANAKVFAGSPREVAAFVEGISAGLSLVADAPKRAES